MPATRWYAVIATCLAWTRPLAIIAMPAAMITRQSIEQRDTASMCGGLEHDYAVTGGCRKRGKYFAVERDQRKFDLSFPVA